MSIEVNQVTKVYGEQKALKDVSFSIKTGEVVGFLGPNGAGKSTLMKIITGVIPPTSGQVKVEGFDVVTDDLEVKRFLGYLPENNPLYLDMFVKEYLEFVAGVYYLPNKKERVEEMVLKTGLTLERKKKIGALSKGYRQRVGLAQALIHDPKVLILDEPTSGLDPNQIIEIRNLITEIGKEKTILLSTHIMQEVKAICGRIIIIKSGQIIADDATGHLQQTLSEEQQVVLIEFNSDPVESELAQVEGITHVKRIKDNHWIVQGTTGKDIRQDLFNFAVSKQIAVLSMQKKEKSLEEVFQELTNK